MRFPHLFEFMDLDWLPRSLHSTLREILGCTNARPFRPYYSWVAEQVRRAAVNGHHKQAVELGAGTAPVSRLLAAGASLDGLRLIVCDTHPDQATYADLEKRYPGRIFPRQEPVDFSRPQAWPSNSLLFLSGTFHHVPPAARRDVLANLTAYGGRVMIFEPLRKTPLSMGFVFLSIVPALLLPLWFLRRPGRLRRFFWCWLIPVAPVIFWWDGVVSCMRMWTHEQWRLNLQKLLGSRRDRTINHSTFSQMISW